MPLSDAERAVLAEQNAQIAWAELTETAYIGYLSEFNEKVAPIFERYGFNKQTALLAWLLCRNHDRLEDIVELLEDRV